MTVVSRPPKSKSCSVCCFKKLGWVAGIALLVLVACVVTNLSLMLHLAIGASSTTRENGAPSPASLALKATTRSIAIDNNNKDGPVVIGHVVSLIKCGRVAQTTGFLDAAAVLRHSIHLQSVYAGKSAYSYQMYAIVHVDCKSHALVLERLGYKTLVVDSPVQLNEIRGEWYRNHVEMENCCGSKEFIKLYAYNLTQHPIVVHWDMDVAVLQPMDDLFDAMLYEASSDKGKRARKRLDLQHPNLPLPDRIDAFFTKDVTSSQPWEPVQGVQGGFLVARPNPQHLEQYLEFIREGNYVRGRGAGSGWGGGMGYGGFQGAMAYQGVVAYFYDVLKPNTAVELNACLWNQVVADVLWRGPARMDEYHLTCRQHDLDPKKHNKTDCEDCRVTPIELVKSAHYTACKKPWECTVPHPRVPRQESQKYRLSHLTNITTCMNLFRKWFELRHDFEQQLQQASGVKPSARDGDFEKDHFMGYCKRSGGYISMEPPPDQFDITKIYGM